MEVFPSPALFAISWPVDYRQISFKILECFFLSAMNFKDL